MYKRASIVAPCIALSLLTLACGGGDDTGTPSTASPTPGETSTERPTEAPTQEPSPTAIEETPAIIESPTVGPSASPAPSPLPAGTPAVAPADLSLYEGMTIDQEECVFDPGGVFDPGAALANCFSRGLYALSPPLTGEDISCSILIVDDEPVIVFCRSEEPQEALYYAIQ